MVNIDDFIKRIEILLDYYSLSASIFADKLGVQRSGLSHLMSGRNKPSLDFVMKIVENFPEVDINWLLNGTGNFPKQNNNFAAAPQPTPEPIVTPALQVPEPSIQKNESTEPDLFSVNEINEAPASQQKNTAVENISSNVLATINSNEEIERIVVFYKNGFFKAYTPGQ